MNCVLTFRIDAMYVTRFTYLSQHHVRKLRKYNPDFSGLYFTRFFSFSSKFLKTHFACTVLALGS